MLTVKDVMAMIGVTERTVFRWEDKHVRYELRAAILAELRSLPEERTGNQSGRRTKQEGDFNDF